MSRHRGREAPPAPQRARAAPGTHARPRRGPALGRVRRRAGSGRRARPAGRSREPCSSTDPKATTAAGTLGMRCRGRQRHPGPSRPSALQTLCGCPADSRRGVGEAGTPEPHLAGMHPRPAPPTLGNTWLSVMPSTQLERLSAVVDCYVRCSHMSLIFPKSPCSGVKLNCAGAWGRGGSRVV